MGIASAARAADVRRNQTVLLVGPVDARIVSTMEPSQRVADGVLRANGLFPAFDLDADGIIDWQDDALRERINRSERRGWLIGVLMAMDLDGDLIVTTDEARRYTLANAWRSNRLIENDLHARADADGDGRVSVRELVDHFDDAALSRSTHRPPALGADTAGVPQVAYLARVQSLFNEADADGDGILSLEEINGVRDRAGLVLLLK